MNPATPPFPDRNTPAPTCDDSSKSVRGGALHKRGHWCAEEVASVVTTLRRDEINWINSAVNRSPRRSRRPTPCRIRRLGATLRLTAKEASE